MLEDYLEYHRVTKEVLYLLRRGYDEEKLAPMLRERERLFGRFESAGWPDVAAAEVVIRDTLKMEKECVKAIASLRADLKEGMNALKNRRYAIGEYVAHAH